MRLLIVGELDGQLSAASKIALDRGAKVLHSLSLDSAVRILRSGKGADLLMVDVALDIASLAAMLEGERIHVPIVACGVKNDARAAARAIRAGAKEYIPLPPDPEIIAAVLAAVADEGFSLIYRDEIMAGVVHLANQVAKSEASILITGESGVGKEVIARHVHRQSTRNGRAFISVNCASIPENLLESELFGHEKGAFTGAIARRIGKFEEADGGTLLLDEISEMDVRLQAKLLRAIQERVIDRVGGKKPVSVNIRIIATSNRDLMKAVREGTFREDLLYRLNVINLVIPPLRKRPGDIVALADHFIRHYSKANAMPERALSQKARNALIANPWPGNVRELENTMHRAVLLSSGAEIEKSAIRTPDGGIMSISQGDQAIDAAVTAETVTRSLVGRTVAQVECELIIGTLDHCLGNRTHAANILGISIRTLRNKLRQYGDQGVDVPAPGIGPGTGAMMRRAGY